MPLVRPEPFHMPRVLLVMALLVLPWVFLAGYSQAFPDGWLSRWGLVAMLTVIAIVGACRAFTRYLRIRRSEQDRRAVEQFLKHESEDLALESFVANCQSIVDLIDRRRA